MKKIFIYAATLVLICFFSLANAQTIKTPENLQGVWMLKSSRTSDKLELGFLPEMSNFMKKITPDGKFSNFTTSGTYTVIITDGLLIVESETVFTESIEHSIHPNLKGLNNKLQFRIENDNKLYLKWFSPKNQLDNTADIWVEELWEKVETPNSNQT